MAKTLDIIDRQLELGDVKTITANGGSVVKFIELLFSSTTKAQFALSNDKKGVDFCIKDVDLELPQYQSRLKKYTLYDLIISLKNIYNQLEDEEENT